MVKIITEEILEKIALVDNLPGFKLPHSGQINSCSEDSLNEIAYSKTLKDLLLKE